MITRNLNNCRGIIFILNLVNSINKKRHGEKLQKYRVFGNAVDLQKGWSQSFLSHPIGDK